MLEKVKKSCSTMLSEGEVEWWWMKDRWGLDGHVPQRHGVLLHVQAFSKGSASSCVIRPAATAFLAKSSTALFITLLLLRVRAEIIIERTDKYLDFIWVTWALVSLSTEKFDHVFSHKLYLHSPWIVVQPGHHTTPTKYNSNLMRRGDMR